MFAPINHPAMKKVAPVRRSLGVRTVFNILGPMTNAANAGHCVIGVFEENLVELMAKSLIAIGNVDHGVVIHGCGLDEISPLGASTIVEVKNVSPKNKNKKYSIRKYKFDPLTVGVKRCKVTDLKGGDADDNAKQLRDVLQGRLIHTYILTYIHTYIHIYRSMKIL